LLLRRGRFAGLLLLAAIVVGATQLAAATSGPKKKTAKSGPPAKASTARPNAVKARVPKASAAKATAANASPAKAAARTLAAKPAPAKATAAKRAAKKRTKSSSPWREPNYAESTTGDAIDGDDPVARRAAVEALGRWNGTVVVAEATTGRILTIVNQKVAYQSGFQPCSTVKIPVALAALQESIIDRDTLIRVYGRTRFAMTEALAKSNNQYFASLGEKLGFARMSYYARLFGLGEKAGLNIPEEQAGIIPAEAPKTGVGMMTSFGDGIYLTPLELAALLGAVANGGTLYYLQYPRSEEEAASLVPRVKRQLDIDQLIPEITPGLQGAVEYGTARRIGPDHQYPIYGKTGTCTDSRSPTHLGWFGSYTDMGGEKLVVVVLLTGGKLVSGPVAAGVAGDVYKNLNAQHFAARPRPAGPVARAGE
jgi:beta-lactamase class D